MTVAFTQTPPPIENLRRFEAIFEPELALGDEEKAAELQGGLNLWMYRDDRLIGEAYGKPVRDMQEQIPDCTEDERDSLYLAGFAIKPEYQREGWGRMLLSMYVALARQHEHRRIITHATSTGMNRLCDWCGFDYGIIHERWYGTRRTATFRTLDL